MTTCGVAKGVPEEPTKSGAKEVHAAERFFKCDFKDHIAVEQYENPFWFREPRASRNGWNSLAEIMKLYTQHMPVIFQMRQVCDQALSSIVDLPYDRLFIVRYYGVE